MIGEYGKSTVRQRRILRKVLVGLIAALVILIIIKAFVGAGSLVLFPISRVDVFGTTYISKSKVLELTGLDAYKSILTFNKVRARRSLLRDGRISGVEIVKLFPDTLRIYVVEKEKKVLLAVVARPVADHEVAEKFYWLSQDGVVLTTAQAGDVAASVQAGPSITLNSNNDDIKIGGKSDDYLLESALKALGGIEKKYPGFYSLIESVSIERDGVYVRLRDKRFDIYLGNSVTGEKLEQLRALLLVLNTQETAGKGKIEIDMSFSQAAIRKRE